MRPFEDESEDHAAAGLPDDEEEEGEDLMENLEEDYRAIPELDVYDPAMLDETEQADASPSARARAEAAIARREAKRRRERGSRLPAALARFMEDEEEESDGEDAQPAPSRRRRLAEQAAMGGAGEDDAEVDETEAIIENLEDRKGNSLRDWVKMESPSREIYRRFKLFLKTYIDASGNNVHAEKIRQMCEANGESLVINYTHLCEEHPVLAIFVADAPMEVIEIFDKAAQDVVLEAFPSYDKIRPEIHVRISNLPVSDVIRDIRELHLNALIKVSGVVTRRTGVYPQLKLVRYTCDKCNFLSAPVTQDTMRETAPTMCPECQSKGPFSVNSEETVYRNYQRITMQESPGSVPAGRLPRQKEVILTWDLVDTVKPGDEIELTGIYRNQYDRTLNAKHGFPVFSTVIEANYVEKKADRFYNFGLTEDDVARIRELARDENIGEKIIKSIAPSIYGHEDVKTAIALSLFGGEAKNPGGSHRVRGDINILIMGDPGTAKSQFLKYVEKTAHRAVFTTGQGASAVGLTASVSMDPLTREWTLQGGALVLADQGVCLIDEFDKMNDQDRVSIHEAMEQQTISVSKAGIVTSLQARCAVIAAANPIRGKYQPELNFTQNVDLTEPILTRFDIWCVVRDVVDPVKDERLASFVVRSHMRSHPSADAVPMDDGSAEGPIPQDLLRKYLLYAKKAVHPKLQAQAADKIQSFYTTLRRESYATGGMPVTVRQVESTLRIAEAHARMHLREFVRDDDIDMAIRVVATSFIESQKFSVMKNMQQVFQKFITYKKDHNQLLLFVLSQLVRETLSYQQARSGQDMPSVLEMDVEEFVQRARHLGIHDLGAFYESEEFVRNHFVLQSERQVIIKEF